MNPEGWRLEDMIDVCDVLEATKRTVPREQWVDSIVEEMAKNSWRTHG